MILSFVFILDHTHITMASLENVNKNLANKNLVNFFNNKNLKVILNKTEGYYFVYQENYENMMKSLFEKNVLGESRWGADDKIVFVPDHLREYVLQTYEFVFPYGTDGLL